LDAQGLIKSAFLTLFAHGPRAGRGWKTIPEKPAALCWQRSFDIDPSASEVHKVRQLLAGLLGYPEPSSPSRFGLSHATFTRPYAAPYVFFAHGAGWDSKLWPVEHWQALTKKLGAEGLTVVLTWGNAAEKQRAEAIAGVCAGVVLAGLDLSSLGAWLAHARLVVGLDTGLSHLAVALGTPTVCLYGPSVPVLLDQPHLINLCATTATTVVRDRPNTLPYAPVAEAVEHVLRGT
jgi:heptosyltransferase-1